MSSLWIFFKIYSKMTKNEEQELLSLIKDNNRMIKDIWTILNNPNNDIKDFIMNIIANQFDRR